MWVSRAEQSRREARAGLLMQMQERLTSLRSQFSAEMDRMLEVHDTHVATLVQHRDDVHQQLQSLPPSHSLQAIRRISSLNDLHTHMLPVLFQHYGLSASIGPLLDRGILTAAALLPLALRDLSRQLDMPALGDCMHMHLILLELSQGRGLPELKSSRRPGTCTERWSVEQVCAWISRLHGGASCRAEMTAHKICGQVLLGLTTSNMAAFMHLSNQQRARIAGAVQKLRTKMGLPITELRRNIKAEAAGGE